MLKPLKDEHLTGQRKNYIPVKLFNTILRRKKLSGQDNELINLIILSAWNL